MSGVTYIAEDMQAMWDGGDVQRFHTCRMLLPDTVGHHSFNVACTLMHVWPAAPAHLLRAALKHDMAEVHAGDMPAPAKRALGIRELFAKYEEEYLESVGIPPENLSPAEAWLLKFCDSVDGLRVTVRERAMGNQLIEYAHANFQKYVDELLSDLPDGKPRVDREIYDRCAALAFGLEKEWEIVSK